MSNFDKLLKDFLAKRDVITSKNLGLQYIGIHPYMIEFHEAGILLYNRDSTIIKTLEIIKENMCECNACASDIAENALREIGELE